MAVCGRLDVSGFQLFRRRRYSKKKTAGRLGAEAAPCTDRGTGDHTFSSSVRRPPRDTAQKGPLEVRQEEGAEPSRRAEAQRPQRGTRPGAMWQSCTVLPSGRSGDTALSLVLLKVSAVTRWRTGSNLSAGPCQGNQRCHLGNLCPLKAGCSNSAKERSGFGERQVVSWLREEPRAREDAGR